MDHNKATLHIKTALDRGDTSNWNGNRLLEPDHRRCVMMNSNEFPACLIEQVTKIGEGAFLGVMVAQHLLVGAEKKKGQIIIMI
jgi:hypothetical protein